VAHQSHSDINVLYCFQWVDFSRLTSICSSLQHQWLLLTLNQLLVCYCNIQPNRHCVDDR